jgi:hypothetical protein
MAEDAATSFKKPGARARCLRDTERVCCLHRLSDHTLVRLPVARLSLAVALSPLTAFAALAQAPAAAANPADVASPDALVRAAYETVSRAPGKPFQWDRFRSLFLPGARLIPNTEQTGGTFTTHTVESFITWIDDSWKRVGIGSPNDRGFAESHVAGITEQFGDIAHVLSTYEKHIWGETQVRGRGVNSFQMVRKDGRWWITSLIWDEETGAGPVPAKYLPAKR